MRLPAPFAIANYRQLWLSDVLSLWGFEMETLILAWFVLVETNSAVMVGIVGALRFGGTLVSPMLGVYVDRLSKRSVMIAMRIVFAAVAAGMFVAASTGALAVWHALLAAGVAGLLRPPEMVVRQALIADLVPTTALVNALGLSRITMDTSKMVGALAGAGAMATLGIANAYLIIGLMYLGSIACCVSMSAPLRTAILRTTSAVDELRVGVRHIRASPLLSRLMLLAFLVNLTAFPLTMGLLPMLARDVFGQDEMGLARMISAAAGGSLLGSVLIGVGRALRAERMMLGGLVIWHVLIVLTAFAPSLIAVDVLLFASGLAANYAMISMSAVLMGHADAGFRGRVMGVRMLCVYGLPLGLLAGGALFDVIGVRATIGVFGATGLVAFGYEALTWRRRVGP